MFTDIKGWVPPKADPIFRRNSAVVTANVETLIGCLDADEPVLLTMSISRSFFRPGPDGVIDSVEPLEPPRIHALVAVGHGRLGKQTLILARNSWGESWGIEGYCWIASSYMGPRLLKAATMTGEL
jgi:hypothetical protein